MKASIFSILFCLSVGSTALGALGGDRKDLDSEREGLHTSANAISTDIDSYTVIRLKTPTSTVTQYANKDGQIFAVKWRGLTHPDMSVVLGKHFSEYQEARKNFKKKPGRQAFSVKTANIVVRHAGHMRDIQGLAYRPNLVPKGVDPEKLQ